MKRKRGIDMDMDKLEKETTITFFRGSGPGGQHRNKVETGVRLKHIPSGIVLEVDEERSQARNREIAFERLADRLEELAKPKVPRVPTKVSQSQREKRLREKKRQSETKELRRSPEDEE